MTRQIIVDKNDNEIGLKSRSEITTNDIYRVSSLWVVVPYDESYKVLIAQRSFSKKNDPGVWGPSVAGTVDEGEAYEQNIIKEAEEEIGLTDAKLLPMSEKSIFHDGKHKYFSKRFVAIGDWTLADFTPQASEVEALDLVDIGDLLSKIDSDPEKYLTSMKKSLQELSRYLSKI